MKLNRIPKVISYKEKAYNEIKSAISNTIITANDILNERSLANDLGISRTPIREALQLLENEGWVVTEPCKGTRVKEITIDDIREVYEMRLALEPYAIKLAIKNITKNELDQLRKISESQLQLCAGIHPENFTEADMNFHMSISAISKNSRLINTINSFMDIMGMYIIRTIKNDNRYIDAAKEHIDIIDAVLKKDVLSAEKAVASHLEKAYTSIHHFLMDKNT